MASALFDESDFEADFGTGGKAHGEKEEEPLCLRSDCVAAREDLDRLTSGPLTTIRLRVYLCFYCRFEDEDRDAMRGHFREAHDMRVHVDDNSEGAGCNEYEDHILQEGGEVDLQDDMGDNQDYMEGSHDDIGNDQYDLDNYQNDTENDQNDTESDHGYIENDQTISSEERSDDVNSKPVDPDTENKLKTMLYEDQVFPYYQSFQKALHKYQEEAKVKFIIRTSEKYCGTQLDRLKYPKIKVRFICGYGYQSHTMKGECPVSFWLRLKNSNYPSQACYVIKNFITYEHNHTSQKKPTVISILKTPEKQSIKQEEPDCREELVKAESIESDLNFNHEESSLPKGTLHKDQVFPNYQVFQRALEEYERESNMKFSIRSSEKTDVVLDKDKFQKKYITFVCQQAIRPKRPLRTTPYLRKIKKKVVYDCPVNFTLTLQNRTDPAKACYTVTKCELVHNHPTIERRKKRSFLDKSVLFRNTVRKRKESPEAPDIGVKQEEVEGNDDGADKIMEGITTGSENADLVMETESDQQEECAAHGMANQEYTFGEGQCFASYREFQRAVREYEVQSNFKFSAIRTSSEKYNEDNEDAPPKREVKLICYQGEEEQGDKNRVTSYRESCPVFIMLWVKTTKDWRKKEYIITHFNKTEHNHPPVDWGAKLSSAKDDPKDEDGDSEKAGDGAEDWKPNKDDDLSSGDDLSLKIENANEFTTDEQSDLAVIPLREEGPVNVHQKQALHQGQNFRNYQEFQRALKEYEEKSNFKFSIRSTSKNKLEDGGRDFPKNQVKVICHLGDKGRNPKQPKKYCTVSLFLCLRRPKDAPDFAQKTTPWYTITRFNKSEHNHPPMAMVEDSAMVTENGDEDKIPKEDEDMSSGEEEHLPHGLDEPLGDSDAVLKAKRQLKMLKSANQAVENNDEESNDHGGQSAPLAVLKNHLPDGLKELPEDSDIIIKAKRQLKVLEGQYGSKNKQDIVLCDVCGQNLPTVSKTIVHICLKYFNTARVLTCFDCGKDFTNEGSLDLHWNRIHLKQEPYICSVVGCDHKSASIEGMRSHMSPREPKSFRSERRVKQPRSHLTLATEERRKMMFDHIKLFRERMMEYKRLSGDWKWKVNPDLSPDPEPPKAPKEEEPRKLCEICGFAGKDQASWNLKAHMVSKHELKYCPVDDCNYSSYRSADITIHRQAWHRAVCTICNYVPGKGRTLDDHRCEDYLGRRDSKVSNNTQTFRCPECPYMAKTEGNLRFHRNKRHGVEFEFKCKDCQAAFKCVTKMREHRWEQHLGRKRLYCDVEGCCFKSYLPKYYRMHIRAGKHWEKPQRSLNATTIEGMKATGARTTAELKKMKRKAVDQRRKEQIEMSRQKARKLEMSNLDKLTVYPYYKI